MTELNDQIKVADIFPSSAKMPVLFLGHGSPMNAIEENQFVQGFREVAKTLPKPSAIICISAHWYIPGTKVTAMEHPKTIHDFIGFPKELYKVQYPAMGHPTLAREIRDLLNPFMAELDENWGLDHGAWSVIKHLYPDADVPVIQISIDYTKPANWHFKLAQQLTSFRDKGILIIGSGNIIHNLRLVDYENFEKDNYGYDWAIEAREIINRSLKTGDYQSLIDYDKQSGAMQLAVPTADHYLPLIYVLGLRRKDDSMSMFNDKLVAGSLSMTSLKFS